MQTKTTMWGIISHQSEWLLLIDQQTKLLVRMWRKGNPFALLVGMQTGVATVASSMEITQKIKNGSAFWPSYPTSGNLAVGTQNTNLKEHKHPNVHRSIIYNHQDMETAQASINRCVAKTTMRHLHNGILLGHWSILDRWICFTQWFDYYIIII